jgi:hypothetical protein
MRWGIMNAMFLGGLLAFIKYTHSNLNENLDKPLKKGLNSLDAARWRTV